MRFFADRKNKCMIIAAVVIVLFYIFVSLTPLYADDFTYYYSFESGFGSEARDETISDLSGLFRSQVGHYLCMNGRVVAHTLAQVFLSMDKIIFDIASSLAFAALGILICFHGNGSLKAIRPMHLILTYASLFLLAPSFGQSYLWLTGSCNYLFTFVIVLLFLAPYRTCFYANKKSNAFISVLAGTLMLLLGALAGNTNENTGVSMAVILILYIFVYLLKNHRIKIWMITGCIGVIVGCAASILAPGNVVKNGGSFVEFSLGSIVKYTIFFTSEMLQYFAPLLIIIAVLLAHIFIAKKKCGYTNKEILLISLEKHFHLYFYGLFFLGSVYSMVLPAQFPARAWSHSLAILVIVLLMILNEFVKTVDFHEKDCKRACAAVSSILIAVSAIVYMTAFPKLNAVAYANQERLAQIEEAKANGETEVSVCSIISTSRYICHDFQGDISSDPDYWMNLGMAKYYGIETITKNTDCIV